MKDEVSLENVPGSRWPAAEGENVYFGPGAEAERDIASGTGADEEFLNDTMGGVACSIGD